MSSIISIIVTHKDDKTTEITRENRQVKLLCTVNPHWVEIHILKNDNSKRTLLINKDDVESVLIGDIDELEEND